MNFFKNYSKFIILFVAVILIFIAMKNLSDKRTGSPISEITSTNLTVIYDNGTPKVKAEAEIRIGNGKGYLVLEIKAVSGSETWERTVNILVKPRKTKKVQNIQVIFDERDIVRKNPEFFFNLSPFLQN
jgi:hypothetical protein